MFKYLARKGDFVMNNYEEYRNKLAKLSEQEKKLRDLYLSEQAKGIILGPTLGVPSLDKPFLKYYNMDEYLKEMSPKNGYQQLKENNKNNLDKIAIDFFGKKITFREFFKNVDKVINAFINYGIKKGDFVTICSAGIPETAYAFFALWDMGAVANMMAPYFDKNGLKQRISDCNSKLFIVMDQFYPEVKDAISDSKIQDVIVIPTLNSSILKYSQKIYKVDKNNNEIYWNDFIKDGNKKQFNFAGVNYEPDMPLVMVYSSGTTGASKGILLSNDSFFNSVQSYPASGVDITSGQKFYQIIPPWYSTGLNTSIYLPLYYGSTVFMDPRFERDVFVKNIIKAKPNYAVAPTSMYEGFLDSKLVKNKDLSFFNYPFEGGEPLRREVAEKIGKVFEDHGSSTSLRTAYGQCECGAAITTQTQKMDNVFGSVGIPIPGVNLAIVDDNFNELGYYERGQILADTKCGMLEYYKNAEETEKYFNIDSYNNKWSCTGDIGYIDKLGNLYVEGRASDYSIINDKKVYNFDIENIIMNLPEVKMCDVLSKDNSNKIAVHLIFNDNSIIKTNEQLMEELRKIQSLIYESIKDLDLVPYTFKIRDSFPYAKSGKRDVNAMKNETENFTEIEKFENYINKNNQMVLRKKQL